MSNQPTAAEQHQSLAQQEQSLLASLGQLLTQIEAAKASLSNVRAAMAGAEIGFKVAQEAVDKPASTDTDPAPEKE
jgi:hypothetical protein